MAENTPVPTFLEDTFELFTISSMEDNYSVYSTSEHFDGYNSDDEDTLKLLDNWYSLVEKVEMVMVPGNGYVKNDDNISINAHANTNKNTVTSDVVLQDNDDDRKIQASTNNNNDDINSSASMNDISDHNNNKKFLQVIMMMMMILKF